MRLFAIGLSHRTAPVELRESTDFSRKGIGDALADLTARGIGRELVVLSTCNRAEVYAVGDTDDFMAVRLTFHEHDQINVTVRRHGPPGA